MSLKGSLKTAALPEVLNFLSNNGKSGEFHVSGSHGEGRLWFAEGRISGFRAAKAEKPFEAIFELLRIDDGEFTFDAEAERPTDVNDAGDEDGQVGPALEAAEARMAEWLEIVEVVPSLSHRLQLRSDRPADDVILDPDQWLMVVAIGAGHSVGEVIDERGLQEFDGCRAVRALVDASLVQVHEPEVHEPEVAEVEVAAPDAAEPGMAEAVVVENPLAGFGFHTPADEATPYPAFGSFGSFGSSAEPVETDHPFGSEPVFDSLPVSDSEAVSDSEPAYGGEQADFTGADQVDGSEESDHYAALRAAMVEIGDDLVTEDEVDEEQPVHAYELQVDPPEDGRAALQALLSEVTAEGGDQPMSDDDHVDGLADRGPWTQHELTAMDGDHGWHDDAEEASNIVPFAPVHAEAEAGEVHADEAEEAAEAAPAEEPINRGLLLKFLSSVRN